MTDVARLAGVSLVTVSRVINTPDQVAPATLAAVRKAVDRLGYVPNLTAGSLVTSRSRIVAAIVPTLANLVFSETIEALSHTLAQGGYQLLVGQTGYRDADEAALVEAFLGRRVDGLVLTGCNQTAALQTRLKKAGVPLVQTWDLPNAQAPLDMAVGFDNVDVGRAAARHLMGRGHRVVGFVGAEESRSHQRLKGFKAQASRGSRKPGEAFESGVEVLVALTPPPASLAAATQSFAQMVSRRPDMTAVFCNNDMLASALLFECHRRGWSVPGRMAILGFADLPIAQAASPSLSTVRVPRAAIGQRAGQMLLARLHDQPGTPREDIGFEVVRREST